MRERAHRKKHTPEREEEEEKEEKMGGGMEANKNRFIEEWGSARETLEQNFRWSRRNLALVGIFGLAVPFFVYKGIVREFVRFPFLSSQFQMDRMDPPHFTLYIYSFLLTLSSKS